MARLKVRLDVISRVLKNIIIKNIQGNNLRGKSMKNTMNLKL